MEKPHWPGREEWIVNNEKYCGKILYFYKAGAECSYHMHKIKDEVMYCTEGQFKIVYGWTDNVDEARETILNQGDSIRIEPLMRHKIVSMQDSSKLIEFSTQHFDSDSYRIKK